MNDPQNIFVRQAGRASLLEWRPSSADARLEELYWLLEEDGLVEEGDYADLVEESTGGRVEPSTPASSLQNKALELRAKFVGYALHQLRLFQSQSSPRFDFELLPRAPAIKLAMRYPGLIQRVVNGQPRVYVRDRHQALMTIPKVFPEKAPSLVWLSPVFHPNLAEGDQVWPPGFD